jgi:hypothetical protein
MHRSHVCEVPHTNYVERIAHGMERPEGWLVYPLRSRAAVSRIRDFSCSSRGPGLGPGKLRPRDQSSEGKSVYSPAAAAPRYATKRAICDGVNRVSVRYGGNSSLEAVVKPASTGALCGGPCWRRVCSLRCRTEPRVRSRGQEAGN